MKNTKKGFTLAEVLITLGILGVVAALTLPTFNVNAKYQAMASKLSSTISSVENSFAAMMSTDSADDLTDTTFWKSGKTTGELATYLKIAELPSLPNSGNYKTLSGTQKTIANTAVAYQMKNGAVLMIDYKNAAISNSDRLAAGGSVTDFIAQIDIDVNGEEKPNKYGRDVFRFALGNNGHLYPCGSLNYSIVLLGDDSLYWKTTSQNDAKCDDNNKSVACTARLIEENYKINF